MKNSWHDFDPNSVGNKANTIFGLPHKKQEAYIHILPVPWEVTTSYKDGTARAPMTIFEASFQVDLYDPLFEDRWKRGYFFLPPSSNLKRQNIIHRKTAKQCIAALFEGKNPTTHRPLQLQLKKINDACENMNQFVYNHTLEILKKGHRPLLLGGDHSTPLRHIKAITDFEQKNIGMLVIDAHFDLRIAYEYFTYSHASIMYNLLQENDHIKHISFVGIRDYCEQEKKYALSLGKRASVFYNSDIKKQLYEGMTWKKIVHDIITSLPQEYLYISVDIDGLMPTFCPNTGTPVAGGLEVDQLFYLLESLYKAGKKIIGADLVEVGHGKDNWDANVGARVLYKLCHLLH